MRFGSPPRMWWCIPGPVGSYKRWAAGPSWSRNGAQGLRTAAGKGLRTAVVMGHYTGAEPGQLRPGESAESIHVVIFAFALAVK